MSQTQLAFRDTLPVREAPAPEELPLAQRLRACSRLLDTAARELTAQDNADTAKRRELSELRHELAREIQSPVVDSEDSEAEKEEESEAPAGELQLLLPQEVARLLAEALYALEERDEEERRMQDRWSSLEEDALKAMHAGGRIVSLRAGRYPEHTPTDARLDLRF